MSFNHTFNHHGNFTFHTPAYVPPPPTPPPYFIPPPPLASENFKQNIVKQFEARIPRNQTKKPKPTMSISKVRDEIRNLVLALKEVKLKEMMLSEMLKDLSEEEWTSNMKQIEEHKAVIDRTLSEINNLNLDVLRKLLAKRSAKRARQKSLRLEKKREKEEWIKENKERSRKIDENLQKIQDDINKVKQEEEAKLQADAILRETLRKKQDAKRYVVKLDALVKLRRARQNTARGRGDNVSENEAAMFNTNIEKLKTLWTSRLALYESEEAELRSKLRQDSDEISTKTKEAVQVVRDNLAKWRDVMFGGELPQVDFGGDVGRFVAVRSQWDQYLNPEGTTLPIGWVPPTQQDFISS